MIIISIFIALIILLILLGLPIYACFGIACIGMIFALDLGTAFVIPAMFSTMNSFTLMAIPFFVFAGILMASSGISERIVDFANTILGRLRGGLGAITIVSCGFFGAISGSSGAAIAGIGSAVLPELDKYGYSRRYSAALLANSGLLGQLIPPSVPMIVFGMITGTSVAAIFLATAVPGVILIFLYIIINYFYCRNRPEIITQAKVPAKDTIKAVGRSFVRNFFALLMPVIILGGIYGGIVTPTEAGAISVVFALLVGFVIYKKLSFKSFLNSLRETTSIVCAIMLIMAVILVLTRILTYERVPMMLGEAITSVSTSKVVVLLLINLFLLIVGMFVGDVPGVLLCAPLLSPLFAGLGVNPVQMAVIFAVNQGTGLMTPPVATNLYIASRVGNVPVADFLKLTIPFLIFGNLPLLVMVTFIPSVSLWLPSLVLGI